MGRLEQVLSRIDARPHQRRLTIAGKRRWIRLPRTTWSVFEGICRHQGCTLADFAEAAVREAPDQPLPSALYRHALAILTECLAGINSAP